MVHIGRKLTVFWYHAAVQVKREDSAGIREVEKQVVSMFQEILESGCKQGQFHVKDPFLVASNIVMMCQTWALKRWLYKDSRTIDQYVDQIVDLISAMVKGNNESSHPGHLSILFSKASHHGNCIVLTYIYKLVNCIEIVQKPPL